MLKLKPEEVPVWEELMKAAFPALAAKVDTDKIGDEETPAVVGAMMADAIIEARRERMPREAHRVQDSPALRRECGLPENTRE